MAALQSGIFPSERVECLTLRGPGVCEGVRRRLLAACCKIHTHLSQPVLATERHIQHLKTAECTYTQPSAESLWCRERERWVHPNAWLQLTVQSLSSSGCQDPSMGPNNKEILCGPEAPIKTCRLVPRVMRGWSRKCWR